MMTVSISVFCHRLRLWFSDLLASLAVADPPPSRRPAHPPFSQTENGKLFAQIAAQQRREGKIP
jgi:hypothetical protein